MNTRKYLAVAPRDDSDEGAKTTVDEAADEYAAKLAAAAEALEDAQTRFLELFDAHEAFERHLHGIGEVLSTTGAQHANERALAMLNWMLRSCSDARIAADSAVAAGARVLPRLRAQAQIARDMALALRSGG